MIQRWCWLLLLLLLLCACSMEKATLKQEPESLVLTGGSWCLPAERLVADQGDNACLEDDNEEFLSPWMQVVDADDEGSVLFLYDLLSDTRIDQPATADDLEIEAKARTGARYEFPIVINKKVERFISYYSTVNSAFMRRSLKRAQLYLPEIKRIFHEYHIPEELAYMALIESGFTTHAYSRAKACGPWQFIAGTGKKYGLTINWWIDERRDPIKSTSAAARYLHDLYGYFDSWYLSAAAYNAGEGKIMRAIKKHKTEDFWEMSRFTYLKRETKEYIPRLIAAILIAREPEKYGLADVGYLPPLTYDEVLVSDATDLQVVAWAAGCKYEVVKDLNPELRYWCTPPNMREYLVKVPTGTGPQCRERLASLPPEQRITFRRHKIRSGESLSTIARHYHTRIQPIKELNNLAGNTIRAGKYLIIPVRSGGAGSVVFAPEIYRAGLQRQGPAQSIIHRPSAYRVRRGDSLWSIARKYRISVADIRSWNGLGRSTLIKPGQVLVLSDQRQQKQLAAASFTTASVNKAIRLRRGDTLWKVSRDHGLTVQQLCRWNNLQEGSILQPGQVLYLSPRADRP
ncbi:MAG: LysM peptidoglycan-binding domain-containing protein [Deltaproteobacteria bacterium]|nr:LysM peptidoglycan-binding domain-containing protein [Candidatus Anaeroferrophillus wilburensis]MBN2889292.1 LysM peptidoglycan-binding domain-containing protein [Deltaproteobacteria bacterium]